MIYRIVSQGQENDIILISLVRGNDKKMIGFLSEKNRLCVALSRARCGLYLFGNQRTLTAARVKKNYWEVGIYFFFGSFMLLGDICTLRLNKCCQ